MPARRAAKCGPTKQGGGEQKGTPDAQVPPERETRKGDHDMRGFLRRSVVGCVSVL